MVGRREERGMERGETKEKRQKKNKKKDIDCDKRDIRHHHHHHHQHWTGKSAGAPGRYLLFNTWAYQTTALSYIF